jgi:hypothetical protein
MAYSEMLSTVYGLISKYDGDKVYIDCANPADTTTVNDFMTRKLRS